jgi:S1-C subfamily serine protease
MTTSSMKTQSELRELARALGGLPILITFPGSPSQVAGLRYGDIVLEVNGKPTPDLDAYVAARGIAKDHMAMRYFRDGKEIEVRLDFDQKDTDGN